MKPYHLTQQVREAGGHNLFYLGGLQISILIQDQIKLVRVSTLVYTSLERGLLISPLSHFK